MPLVGHLLYLVAYTLRGAADLTTKLSVFVGVAVALAVVVGTVSWRYTRRKPRRTALVPVGLGLVYAAPLLWFADVLQSATLRLDSISVLMFVGATLFVASALLTYSAGRGVPGSSELTKRRR